MALGKKIKSTFGDTHKITPLRYKAAKMSFMVCCFLFFLNYFFVGARFHYETNLSLLPFTYTLFVFSLFFYVFYGIAMKLQDKVPKPLIYLLFFILAALAIVFLFSFVLDLGDVA